MPRRRKSTLTLSAEQARAALGFLIDQGQLAASEVRKALQRRDRLIKTLKASLAALEKGVGRVARQFWEGPFPIGRRAKTAKRPAVRKKARISPATRKLYQQQGRYMAALRPLSKAKRAKVKAVRAKSGVRAAIATAKTMAKA